MRSSPSLANVENTPIKLIPIQTFSYEHNTYNRMISTEENHIVEETPIKEEDSMSSDAMAREIQRLSLRLRSSTPSIVRNNTYYTMMTLTIDILVYNVTSLDQQPLKPATLHLSQVVNRVSRCHYVLRRYVREAEKCSPKPNEKRPASQPLISINTSTLPSQESKLMVYRRGVYIDKDHFFLFGK